MSDVAVAYSHGLDPACTVYLQQKSDVCIHNVGEGDWEWQDP